MKAAKALGLTIPQVLIRADEIQRTVATQFIFLHVPAVTDGVPLLSPPT
jgi:hypothetical protein